MCLIGSSDAVPYDFVEIKLEQIYRSFPDGGREKVRGWVFHLPQLHEQISSAIMLTSVSSQFLSLVL